MLVHAVVVGSDRASAHIHIGPQLGIADVAEVIHFAATGNGALFHLNEIADLAVIANCRSGPEVGKRSDCSVASHLGLVDHRVQHGDTVPKHRILQKAAGSQTAVVADLAGASQVRLSFDHHIATELAGFTQAAAVRIHKGDPLIHPVLFQALLQQGFALSQLAPVVDAVHFIGILHFQVHGPIEHANGVGEVQLALVVVSAQRRQHGRELAPVEAVDACIGEVVAALLLIAVAMLNDGAHQAIRSRKNAAIACGVVQSCRQQGHIGATAPVCGHQLIDGFGTQQRYVAIQHQQLPLKTLQWRQQLLHGMARAVLRILQDKFKPADGAQLLFNTIGLMANNQNSALWLQIAGAGQNPLHQRGASQWLQHLWQCTLHAGAFACGQNSDSEHEQQCETGGIYRMQALDSVYLFN